MNFKLIKVIRKDDNDNLSELTRLTMYVDLLMEPKVGMTLGLPNGGEFYINHIKQDLKSNIVLLYEFDDICHREFWDDEFWEKYLDKLYGERWLILPKKDGN